MKRKIYLAITLVIATLLITSGAGLMAQNISLKNEKEEEITQVATTLNVPAEGLVKVNDIAVKVPNTPGQSTLPQFNKISADKKVTLSTPVAYMDQQVVKSPSRVNIRAEHPAMAYDGNQYGTVAYQSYEEGGDPEDICWFSGTENSFDTIGTGGEGWGIYYVDDLQNPIKYETPSMAFRGFTVGGDPMFGGSMMCPGDVGNGAHTPQVNVIGNPTINFSWESIYWDWSSYGWNQETEEGWASGGDAYLRDHPSTDDWATHMNTFVLDSDYSTYEMENYMFVQYATNGTSGTISWYYWPDGNNTQSCDVVVDQNANLFWADNYSNITGEDDDNIEYCSYAVFDPLNATTGQRGLGLRLDDWEITSALDGDGAGALWIWYDDNPAKDYNYPVVEADNGNLIVAMEVHNGTDIGIEIWHTDDGDPGNLERVTWIEGEGLHLRYPHISHVQPGNDDFVIKFMDVDSDNRSYYQMVSYDGGQTWEGIYFFFDDADYKGIPDNKALCTSDFHFVSMWQWDNSSFPDTRYQLIYGWDSVKLFGYAYIEEIGGEPAPLTETTIEELTHGAPPTIYSYNVEDNMYEVFLLYGFQAFANPTAAQLRVIMKDVDSSCSVNTLETTEELFFPAYPPPHAIQFDSVVDIHYRDAKDFPHHYARVDTGASVMKMLLDYLMLGDYDEQTLYDTYAGGDTFDSDELAQGLNAELRDAMPEGMYWYFFGDATNATSPNRPLMYMLLMMDYPADYYHPGDPEYPPLNGHPQRIPAAVPINGTYDQWVVVRGMHTDKASWPAFPQDVVIHGLWLDDPILGGWSHTYVTGDSFLNDYYFQVDGEYIVVCDPPQEGGIPEIPADSSITLEKAESVLSQRQQRVMKYARGGLGLKMAENFKIDAARQAYEGLALIDFNLCDVNMPALGEVIEVNGNVVYTENAIITLNDDGSLAQISI